MVWAVTAAVVVSAGVSLYEGSQSSKNAKAGLGVANTELGMQQVQFGEQQQYAAQLQNLIANPSQVTSLPGYQFMFDQGNQAVERASAAKGFLNSGNEGTALVQYGQGFATNALTQQEQLLTSLSGLSAPVQGNPVGGQNAATNSVNSQNAQLNNLLSQLGLAAGRFGSGASSGTPGSSYTPTSNPGFGDTTYGPGTGGSSAPYTPGAGVGPYGDG